MSPRRWDCMTKGLHLSLLQRIGSIICIFALLFSNVAGFVHLGCTQRSSSETTHAHPHLSDSSDDHHQCGHSHSHVASDETNDSSTGNHSLPHDSDHHEEDTCNVCKSVYTNEDNAIAAESTDSIIELVHTERLRSRNEFFCSNFLFDLSLVRGPPRI